MRHGVLFVVASLVIPLGIVGFACGGSGSSGPDQDSFDGGGKKTDSGGGDDGSSSSGDTGGGGDGAPSCQNLSFQASDNPTCDTCAKDKCCKEVLACANDADCQAFNKCVGACANNDTSCILTCAALHDKGSGIAQDLAACAQNNCQAECPLPDAGNGGFDF